MPQLCIPEASVAAEGAEMDGRVAGLCFVKTFWGENVT